MGLLSALKAVNDLGTGRTHDPLKPYYSTSVSILPSPTQSVPFGSTRCAPSSAPPALQIRGVAPTPWPSIATTTNLPTTSTDTTSPVVGLTLIGMVAVVGIVSGVASYIKRKYCQAERAAFEPVHQGQINVLFQNEEFRQRWEAFRAELSQEQKVAYWDRIVMLWNKINRAALPYHHLRADIAAVQNKMDLVLNQLQPVPIEHFNVPPLPVEAHEQLAQLKAQREIKHPQELVRNLLDDVLTDVIAQHEQHQKQALKKMTPGERLVQEKLANIREEEAQERAQERVYLPSHATHYPINFTQWRHWIRTLEADREYLTNLVHQTTTILDTYQAHAHLLLPHMHEIARLNIDDASALEHTRRMQEELLHAQRTLTALPEKIARADAIIATANDLYQDAWQQNHRSGI